MTGDRDHRAENAIQAGKNKNDAENPESEGEGVIGAFGGFEHRRGIDIPVFEKLDGRAFPSAVAIERTMMIAGYDGDVARHCGLEGDSQVANLWMVRIDAAKDHISLGGVVFRQGFWRSDFLEFAEFVDKFIAETICADVNIIGFELDRLERFRGWIGVAIRRFERRGIDERLGPDFFMRKGDFRIRVAAEMGFGFGIRMFFPLEHFDGAPQPEGGERDVERVVAQDFLGGWNACEMDQCTMCFGVDGIDGLDFHDGVLSFGEIECVLDGTLFIPPEKQNGEDEERDSTEDTGDAFPQSREKRRGGGACGGHGMADEQGTLQAKRGMIQEGERRDDKRGIQTRAWWCGHWNAIHESSIKQKRRNHDAGGWRAVFFGFFDGGSQAVREFDGGFSGFFTRDVGKRAEHLP